MTRLWRYFIVLSSRIAGTGSQFIVQVVVGQFLGAAALGSLSLVQTWVALFGTLSGLGTPTFVLRRTAQKTAGVSSHGRQRWLQFGLLTSAVCGLVAAAVGGAIVLFWPGLAARTSPELMGPVLVGGLGYAAARVLLEEMKGRHRVELSMILEFTAPFAVILLALPLMLVLDVQWRGLVVASAYSAAFVVIGAWAWREATRGVRFISFANWRRRLSRFWLELLSLAGVLVGNQAATTLPLILLAPHVGLATVGAFGIILRLIGVTSTISATLSAHYVRQVINAYRTRNMADVARLYIRTLALNGGLSALLLAPMIVFPDLFLGLFGKGVATADAAAALRLIACLQVFRQFAGLSQVFLSSAGRSRFDVLGQGMAIAVILLIMASGLLPVTIASAALAAGLSAIVRALISFTAVHATVRPLAQAR